MPTDTAAADGRDFSDNARAPQLSAAATLLAEQYGCSRDAAFDALLDIARRNHASVANAAEHVLSRPSAVDGRREQQEPRIAVPPQRAAPTTPAVFE
ncbi:ANTAR domain-containing protein [Rhodococcus sp. WB9]|uniref:ANTAR domain-containing protein n=1 Tax=Rhodococcus sp. WB9 TaxID=2594007 RepID=UPI001185E044|nr:ANTAR domain-containing protein [Rhodococcus sp. WB9]QDQ92445.1 ANTAR domain-containing protein [Rhodococcus sp. WB9]